MVGADGGTRHITAGTVDQHIDLSPGTHDFVCILFQYSLVRDIRLQEHRLTTGRFHFCSEPVSLLFVSGQHSHPGTVCRQVLHHRAAEDSGTSRDDDYFIFYVE